MLVEDRSKLDAVQARPWWTTGSRFALAFLVASNLAVLATIFVPEFSHWRDRHLQQAISESDRQQQLQIAQTDESLQSLNRQVEITRLLFDHFFGKSSREQTAVVSYLRFQFPNDLRQKSMQAILNTEARPSVRRQITKSVASVQKTPVGQSKVDIAVAQEERGFRSLIVGDLVGAKTAFASAYRAYPHYHNVDEISHRVLTDARVRAYSRSRDPAILKDAIGAILTSYSWGAPPELLSKLEKRFAALR